jgi:hypothetical protein
MVKKSKQGGAKSVNMHDVIPRPLVQSEKSVDGRTVLLKPKFRHPILVKYLQHRMKHPFYRITLDEVGTAVWQKIDSQRNAVEIADELEQELGEKIQPKYERLGRFISMLKNAKLIEY